jgi:hypothetical protein
VFFFYRLGLGTLWTKDVQGGVRETARERDKGNASCTYTLSVLEKIKQWNDRLHIIPCMSDYKRGFGLVIGFIGLFTERYYK